VSCPLCQALRKAPVSGVFVCVVCGDRVDAGSESRGTVYPNGLPGFHATPQPTEVAASIGQLAHLQPACTRVFVYLQRKGDFGATDFEGEMELSMFSFPKRRCDLTRHGLVVPSGVYRQSPRKVSATVWVVASTFRPVKVE
jgi:hypothetical protein